MSTDYTEIDPTGLDLWLMSVDLQMSMYAYKMLSIGLNRNTLTMLTDKMLIKLCKMHNPMHRKKLLKPINKSNQTKAPDAPPVIFDYE